ncbi:MAG: hypothetical protein GY913_09085 [Proteobacteria bacterium]|nr:hypothetical protein [Pseudomonadota bacterium]MCP4917065.1 hypothetical protein [Pseudomonadota bacterium]
MIWALVAAFLASPVVLTGLLLVVRNKRLLQEAEAGDPPGSVEVERQEGLRLPVRVLRLHNGKPQLTVGEAHLLALSGLL